MNVRVSGMQMIELRIPRRCVHGYGINDDAGFVDHRRYRRMFRRMLARLPRVPPSDERFVYVRPCALRRHRLRRSVP